MDKEIKEELRRQNKLAIQARWAKATKQDRILAGQKLREGRIAKIKQRLAEKRGVEKSLDIE